MMSGRNKDAAVSFLKMASSGDVREAYSKFVVHLFRFEEGLIVELWDLGQPVLEESPNQYGMF